MPTEGYEHWDKLINLIQAAKRDPAIRRDLSTGSPTEVARVLQEAGIDLEDIGQIAEDARYLANKETGVYWHP